MGWKPIETAPNDTSPYNERAQVDLWMRVHASPRSFGMGDAFRVTNCWKEAGKWFHIHNSRPAELFSEYITHWMPTPEPPK